MNADPEQRRSRRRRAGTASAVTSETPGTTRPSADARPRARSARCATRRGTCARSRAASAGPRLASRRRSSRRTGCDASVSSRKSPVTRYAICSPMSTAWSPIRSTQRETTSMRRPYSRSSSESPSESTSSTAWRFARSISSSSSLQRLRLLEVALGERVERDADHLLGPLAHVLERAEDRLAADVEPAHQLRQLRDRHAVVGHPLEVEVDAQDREHEPEVDRDRRLPGEQRLHALLDLRT